MQQGADPEANRYPSTLVPYPARTMNESEAQWLQATNSQRPINKLPSEVLSRIFVLCKHKQREPGYADPRMTVLSSICRYWRTVALDTKSLWSLITLSDGSPFHFSALCLSRSGATTPLDIEIRLSNKLWGRQFHPEPGVYMYLHAILDGLDFIVARGGSTSRWRSFWLYTPENVNSIDPQMAALNFIGKHPMPALERLEFKYDGPHWYNTERGLRKKALFHGPPPTNLKVATLEWVPNSCLFTSPDHSQLAGLTRLELKFSPILPKLEDIYAVLAAIPKLRVLSIDTRLSSNSPSNLEDRVELVRRPKVDLSSLRALALLLSTRPSILSWEHGLLLMLGAPNVKSIRLCLLRHRYLLPHNRGFIEYLINGTDLSNPRPLFPSLTGLELSIEPDETSPHIHSLEEELLAAYPSITTLVLPLCISGGSLSTQPWLVPCLNRLFIPVTSAWELEDLIAKRCRAGLGPKIVEVPAPSDSPVGRDQEISDYKEVFDGLGVDIRFSYSNCRVREVLGFEE